MTLRFTFTKQEKLCHKNDIDMLFKSGQSFSQHPLRVVFDFAHSTDPRVRVMISVPKRKFKHAVARNRIKRLIRESYRVQKHVLTEKIQSSTKSLDVAFIYIGDKPNISLTEIDQVMILSLDRLYRNI